MTSNTSDTSFFDIINQHDWQLIEGTSNRWTLGREGAELTIEQVLLGDPERLPHYHCFKRPRQEQIHLMIWPEGGLLSYQRHNGSFLHTLAMKSAYRQQVASLNLVPLIDLRTLLEPMVEPMTSEGTRDL